MGTNEVQGFGGNSEVAALSPGAAFSFVGVKGYKADQAFQTSTRASDYTGYFFQDVKTNYNYFQRDFVKFLIKDPNQPDTITLGDQKIQAPSLYGAQGGFQLTGFDRVRLRQLIRPETSDALNEIYLTGDITNASQRSVANGRRPERSDQLLR